MKEKNSTAEAPGVAETAETYDVIVIGGGPVGITAAGRAHAEGMSVALVERELVGGECNFWGCVPSKSLLRPVLAVSDARRVDGAREAIVGAIDSKGVFARRDRYVTNWDDTPVAETVVAMGPQLVRGHATLDGVRRVLVSTDERNALALKARHAVVICSGSTAALPDLPGLAEVNPWTNRKATDSSTVPARLAVVGGGGVGVEMATAWRGLGAAVTLLARGDTLLPRMEPFVGEHVRRGLGEAGVDVRMGVSVTAVHRPQANGPIQVSLDNGEQVEVDEILFATGRTPNTTHIGLDTVGLRPGTWLDVDDTCLVRGVDGQWLYALGDVNRRALLTHQGKYQARIAGAVIGARARGRAVDTAPWSAHSATANNLAVPQAFFTDPEAGSVGLTAEQARQRGHRTRVVDVDMGTVPGANFYADGYRGTARIVVDEDHQYLLGATMVGPGVVEMLHAATIAVAGQVPIARLWHAVPCFPTVSEVWLKLLEAYRDGAGMD